MLPNTFLCNGRIAFAFPSNPYYNPLCNSISNVTFCRSGFNQRLAGVNQRLMSPYSGDLAEWLCKAIPTLFCRAEARPTADADNFRIEIEME